MAILTESGLRRLIKEELRKVLNENQEFSIPTTVGQLLQNIKAFTQGGMEVQGGPARRAGGVLSADIYQKAFDMINTKVEKLKIPLDAKILVYGPTSPQNNQDVVGNSSYVYDVVYKASTKGGPLISLPQEMKNPLQLKSQSSGR